MGVGMRVWVHEKGGEGDEEEGEEEEGGKGDAAACGFSDAACQLPLLYGL